MDQHIEELAPQENGDESLKQVVNLSDIEEFVPSFKQKTIFNPAFFKQEVASSGPFA